MIAIVCCSPFHIFTAIVLRKTRYEKQDVEIIVLNYFMGVNELVERLKKEKIFIKVISVNGKKELDRYHYKHDRIFMFHYLMSSKKYLRKYGIDVSKIDELVYPYSDPLAIIIAKEMSDKGSQIIFSAYDDGTGSYLTNFNSIIPSKIELMFRVPMRFYIPNYILTYNINKSEESIGISKYNICLPKYELFKERINRVFGYSQERLAYKYIFFDQYGEYFDEASSVINLLKRIDNNFKSKCVVKKHPKRSDNVYEQAGLITNESYNKVPFEVISLNDELLESRVLISDYSTACFTPKQIFNAEPQIVFLFRILHRNDPEKEIQRFEKLYKEISDLYIHKERVLAPLTVQELCKFINSQ